MLEQMTLGDDAQRAAATLHRSGEHRGAGRGLEGQQAEKGRAELHWHFIASALNAPMFARDASFGDDPAAAYGIEWTEDLFAPGNQDNRYTTNVEAYLAPSMNG